MACMPYHRDTIYQVCFSTLFVITYLGRRGFSSGRTSVHVLKVIFWGGGLFMGLQPFKFSQR